MKIETVGQLLTAESKPYNVDGNSGTSHKLRFNIDGEIYVCKSTENQVQAMKPHEGESGIVTIRVLSRKENMSLECVSFMPEEDEE